MSRLIKIERTFARIDDWTDRVVLSPAGLAVIFAAISTAALMGWIP